MKKLILSIAMGLVGMTTYAQTQCYKDSLAWTLQGGLKIYLPFCGNNYNNSTIPSNVRVYEYGGNCNLCMKDSIYQLLPTYNRPTLTTDRFNLTNSAMYFSGDDFLAYKLQGMGFPSGNNYSFSIAVWVKANGSSVGTPQVILTIPTIKVGVSQFNYFGIGGLLYLEGNQVKSHAGTVNNCNPNGTPCGLIKNLGNISTEWQHYGVTYNHTNQKIYYYKNGAKIDSATASDRVLRMNPSQWGNQSYLDHLVVGGYPDLYAYCGSYTSNGGYKNMTNLFEGKLDDILVYNRALSDNEVASIYETSGNYDLEKVDTMYIHDTITIVNCQYYDTTYVNVYDTIQVPFYYDAPIYVYDTINVYDTIRVDVYDTIYVNVNVYDTIRINVYDTLFIDFKYTNDIPSIPTEYIKVYPNPVMGSMALNIDVGDLSYFNSPNQFTQYVLMNDLGQCVHIGPITNQLTSLNIDNLSSGTYVIYFTNNLGQWTDNKKITIIK